MSVDNNYAIIPLYSTQSRLAESENLSFFIRKLFAWVSFRLARQKSRKALLQLENHLLEDIGVSRAQAVIEGGKGIFE